MKMLEYTLTTGSFWWRSPSSKVPVCFWVSSTLHYWTNMGQRSFCFKIFISQEGLKSHCFYRFPCKIRRILALAFSFQGVWRCSPLWLGTQVWCSQALRLKHGECRRGQERCTASRKECEEVETSGGGGGQKRLYVCVQWTFFTSDWGSQWHMKYERQQHSSLFIALQERNRKIEKAATPHRLQGRLGIIFLSAKEELGPIFWTLAMLTD